MGSYYPHHPRSDRAGRPVAWLIAKIAAFFALILAFFVRDKAKERQVENRINDLIDKKDAQDALEISRRAEQSRRDGVRPDDLKYRD
jgi:hypothetical protein